MSLDGYVMDLLNPGSGGAEAFVDEMFEKNRTSSGFTPGMDDPQVFQPRRSEDTWLTGINRNLIAELYEVDRYGTPINTDVVVRALMPNAQEVVSAIWTTPFDADNGRTVAPTLSALAQSGQIKPLLSLIDSRFGTKFSKDLAPSLDNLEGRSALTRLNSTAVFAGAAPVKMNVELFIKAYQNPALEVEKSIAILKGWAVPIELAEGGYLHNAIKNFGKGSALTTEAINTLFPSKSPGFIALNYAGYLYAPLAIESITFDLTNPMDRFGNRMHTRVQMQLTSLRAIDRKDVAKQLGDAPYAP